MDTSDPTPQPTPKPVPRTRALPIGECRYCDNNRSDQMMPYHDPSSRCESGKRNHCTCDVCF